MLAWKQRFFRAEMDNKVRGGALDKRSRPGFSLLSAPFIELMQQEGIVTSSVATRLEAYVGRRALGVRLIRRRGPRTNAPIVACVTYVPASETEQVRAGFIKAVAARMHGFNETGEEWVIAGDWQASPAPSWRAGGTPNKAHDDALAMCFWASGSDRPEDAPVGTVVNMNLDHESEQFSWHSPTGQHRTIDHAFTDPQSAVCWRAAASGLTFLGGHGADHTSDSLFDHRVWHFECSDGELEKLGVARERACRMRSPNMKTELGEIMKYANVDWGVEPHLALTQLETEFHSAAQHVRERYAADPESVRVAAPDDIETRLNYFKGLVTMISDTVEQERNGVKDENELRAFFASCTEDGLYRANLLARTRDAALARAVREGRRITWRQLRNKCLHAATRAYVRLQPLVAAKKKAEREAIRLGTQEPADAEALARQLLQRQRELGAAKRGAGFTLTALRGDDGEIHSSAKEVHDIARQYGVAQNGVSRCHPEAVGAWLAAFVPRGAELTLPNGEPWTLRDAIPFDVFAREVQRAASNKAPALHPFLVDYLQLLPKEHPMLESYYELLMRCMETGVYPAHYLQLVAILIPKTYGNVIDIGALRDIWLISHGAKLAERCLLHLSLAPLSRRYLLAHAGGCKGRGCKGRVLGVQRM